MWLTLAEHHCPAAGVGAPAGHCGQRMGSMARDLALAAGADLFVEKPMRLREILDTVRKLLAR